MGGVGVDVVLLKSGDEDASLAVELKFKYLDLPSSCNRFM